MVAILTPAPGAGQTRNYDELVAEGVIEFQAQRWEEARSLFMQAERIRPTARVRRAIGMAAFELREYPDAVHYLRLALTTTEDPLTPSHRTQARALLERAVGFVNEYTFSALPADANLHVDGVRLDQTTVLLPIGRHELTVSRDGYETTRRQLRVFGGKRQHLEFELTKTPGGDPEGSHPPSDSPRPRKSPGAERAGTGRDPRATDPDVTDDGRAARAAATNPEDDGLTWMFRLAVGFGIGEASSSSALWGDRGFVSTDVGIVLAPWLSVHGRASLLMNLGISPGDSLADGHALFLAPAATMRLFPIYGFVALAVGLALGDQGGILSHSRPPGTADILHPGVEIELGQLFPVGPSVSLGYAVRVSYIAVGDQVSSSPGAPIETYPGDVTSYGLLFTIVSGL